MDISPHLKSFNHLLSFHMLIDYLNHKMSIWLVDDQLLLFLDL